MAVATHRFDFAAPIETHTSVTKGSLFKRILAGLKASRELQARREIARHMHLIEQISGRRDAVERSDLPF